jgi:hypothetical protein
MERTIKSESFMPSLYGTHQKHKPHNRNRRRIVPTMTEDKEHYCEICGKEISKEEYEAYDGLCWECWDDKVTEEINATEGTDEEFVPI